MTSPAHRNPVPTADRPALCVLGLGLIGGSLLRRAAAQRSVLGWSPSAATRAAAAGDGYPVADTLEEALGAAVARDALVVLAAPLTAFPELLGRIGLLAPTVRLTDVASVKEPVHEMVAELAPRTRFVGGHPMAGTQHSGWSAGSTELFDGAAWVTTLTEETDPQVWADVAELAVAAGSRVVPCEPAAHDRAVARISHLPHLLAMTLAQVGADGGALALALAAGSFTDGTRVAATRPELVRAMCETNRDELVDALDRALGILGVARASLASTGSLAKLTEAGHRGRLEFETRDAGVAEFVMHGDDVVEQLLAVGAAGGWVSSVERTGAAVRAVGHASFTDDDLG